MSGDPRFHELLRQIGELHDQKQRDYGSDEDPFANVRASERWGIDPWIGALVRLNDKVHRLQQFARKGELANESAEDSMLDIAVYALISLILYREEQPDQDRDYLERLREEYEVPPPGPETTEQFEARMARNRGQKVSTPTAPFQHKPCLRCQTGGSETAGSDPALD